MIYFLINNNYQYFDFELHLSDINRRDVSLIEIPHTLDEREHSGFRSVFRYLLASKKSLIAQVHNFIQLTKHIDREIQPTKNDVIFFYTEYELLNQYIVVRFKNAGAKAYLIEDGGLTGTYLPFRMIESETLCIREKVKEWIYKRLPNLGTLRLHKVNGQIIPWMADTYIDGVCLYRPISIRRSIPTVLLQRPMQPEVVPIQGRVVFLNEQTYDCYQSSDDYLAGLRKIMESLCHGFDTVFFKYHPRETKEWRLRIMRYVLSRFSDLRIIEENTAVEAIIDRYRPSVAASYLSAGLHNLVNRGVEPLYLYHLIPDLSQQPISREATTVLRELGYNFVPSFSEVDSSFRSGLLGTSSYYEAITLPELVGLK